MGKTLLILLSFMTITFTHSEPDLSSIVKVLKEVESLNDSNAVGDNGKAYGILQIHKVYVDEVNEKCGTEYTHNDMFDETCAEEVFHLYMELASERFINKYNKLPTEQDIVRMHNGGMYRGYRIKATKKYYNRYLRFKRDTIK